MTNPLERDDPRMAVKMSESETDYAEPKKEVEGVEEGAGDGWGDYPLDAVFVRTETRSVSEVVKRIDNKRYILDPDFQRDFVWPPLKQSKLIESCIMRIPLPVFYVAEAKDGRIIVVDGLQRLTTFARFLGNKFKLTGLASGDDGRASNELEGKFFDDLPLSLQERVLDTQLTMYILDAKAPERARLDIFERVNSGEQLTRQQMRNALYNGVGTNWLKDAAGGAPFQAATGRSLNPKAMRDREAINRFCAFKLLGREKYTTSDMDRFLAEGLAALSSLSDDERSLLRKGFDAAMLLNHKLFGEHAFRKSLAGTTTYRTVINISLFEVCAVTMNSLRADLGIEVETLLHDAIVDLVRDREFDRSITYSTNSTVSVQRRFSAMEKVISKVVRA